MQSDEQVMQLKKAHLKIKKLIIGKHNIKQDENLSLHCYNKELLRICPFVSQLSHLCVKLPK